MATGGLGHAFLLELHSSLRVWGSGGRVRALVLDTPSVQTSKFSVDSRSTAP